MGKTKEKMTELERAEYVKRISHHPYLKITEAAALVKKSTKTIYDAIYAGELKYLAHGRRYMIKRADLDDWMDRGLRGE